MMAKPISEYETNNARNTDRVLWTDAFASTIWWSPVRMMFWLIALVLQPMRPFPDWKYPQLWNFASGKRRVTRFVRWLCENFIGHELSETEWGYGGDGYVDRWCRWCNLKIGVAKQFIKPEEFPVSEWPSLMREKARMGHAPVS